MLSRDHTLHDLIIHGANIIADLVLISENEAIGEPERNRKCHEAFKTMYGVEYNRFDISLTSSDRHIIELLNIRGNAKIYSHGTEADLHSCDQLIEEWFEWKDSAAFWMLPSVTRQLADIKAKLSVM